MGAEALAACGGWGTWEELILGGAVLRHGADDWNVVASELHARTRYPCAFTPQACKEKYEDLQRRYSGSSTAWFDELRKQRVAELKRQLAKSDDSIGSLESKIKSLEGERKNYDRNEPQSPSLALGSNLTEPLSLETSNNENSAGSFIEDTITRANWSFENQDNNNNNCSYKLVESNSGNGGVVTRKRRGQRIRKDHSNRAVKETSVSGSDNLREPSSNDCGPLIRKDGLLGIFECVAESEPGAVFRHRMDSQKRARYRRVIKQHVDIGTIRSRIIGRSIRSAKELFRDLLLVANNALVFYSRRTREYKSAASLRHLVMKEYKKHCMGSSHESTSAFVPCNPPVKPRTARPRPYPYPRPPPPCKEKVSKQALPVDQEGLGKQSGFDDNISRNNYLLSDRKGLKRNGKSKCGLVDTRDKSCGVKQTKRVRK
ncbi:hypothetical protein OROMI_023661 [Orobanche minor]